VNTEKVWVAVRGMAGNDGRLTFDSLEIDRVSTMKEAWGGYRHRTRTGNEVGLYVECEYDGTLVARSVCHWSGPINLTHLAGDFGQGLLLRLAVLALPHVRACFDEEGCPF
jgi:hypothetical protein